MNTVELWKKRFKLFVKEMRTYGKYIFNDHLKFVLIFAIGIGAYYYHAWLQTLSASFPTTWIMTIIFSFVVTNGSVQTFVKRPDIVFLLPIEEKMKSYFKMAFSYSYFVQLLLILVVGLVLAPLYNHQYKEAMSTYVILLVLLAIVACWNLLIVWEQTYRLDERVRIMDYVIRFGLSFAFTFSLLSKMSVIYTVVIVFGMGVYVFSLYRRKGKQGYNWEYLIDDEEKKMLLLYRIANLFTDVPQLKERVKRRKWLDIIAKTASFSKQNTYSFLYIRTFLRSGSYFGMFVRQLILGNVIVYYVPFLYARIFISLLFIYIIAYQLLSLAKHYHITLWVNLYPIAAIVQRRAFLTLLMRLLVLSSVVFSIVFAFATYNWIMTAVVLLCNLVFSYGFTYGYSSKRMKIFLP